MAKRTLTPSGHGRSGQVRLPKGELELDGVVDEDGEVVRTMVDVRRTGRGRYEVVLLDEDLKPLDFHGQWGGDAEEEEPSKRSRKDVNRVPTRG